jgi:hypothetical protein
MTLRFSAQSQTGEAGGSTAASPATFTIIVEFTPDADKQWSASLHRQDGSLISAVAGTDIADVMAAAASVLDGVEK